jgi:ribosomal protein S18 acetylase RimI-like enzyme
MAAADFVIRPIEDRDIEAVVKLWGDCQLTVSYNDPVADIQLARQTPSSTVLVGLERDQVVATAMAGSEGHRGWLYYVAVDPGRRGKGYAKKLIAEAERFLAAQGVPKVQLMIRETNQAVRAVYEKLGYEHTPRLVMARWLKEPAAAAPAPLTTTVTFLEMLENPRRHVPAPYGVQVALMRAHHPTVGFYRFLFDAVGRDWVWISRRFWSDAELARVIQNPKVELTVLYVAGVPAGYFELDRTAANEVELSFFGLMPEFIGQGLGRFMINAAVSAAWVGEPGRVWVHTCDLDHPRALSLYQKAGFKPYRQETETLKDPRLVGLSWPKRR